MKCFRLALVASFLCAGLPVLADTYDCKTGKASWGGWVTPQYIFVVNYSETQASVYDAIIKKTQGKPINVTVTENTERAIRMRWTLKKLPSMNRATGASSGTIDMKYSAVLNKKKNTFLVRGTVMNGGGGSSGDGTCSFKASSRKAVSKSQEVSNDSASEGKQVEELEKRRCLTAADSQTGIIKCD